MTKTTPFVISECRNPSGKVVFRLSGRRDGKRVRGSLSTHAEAAAERDLPPPDRFLVTARTQIGGQEQRFLPAA